MRSGATAAAWFACTISVAAVAMAARDGVLIDRKAAGATDLQHPIYFAKPMLKLTGLVTLCLAGEQPKQLRKVRRPLREKRSWGTSRGACSSLSRTPQCAHHLFFS